MKSSTAVCMILTHAILAKDNMADLIHKHSGEYDCFDKGYSQHYNHIFRLLPDATAND